MPHKLLLLAFVAGGCIHRPAPVRLAQATPVALAVVIDRDTEILKSRLEGAPDEIVGRLQGALEERNLSARPVAEEKRAALEAARDTKKRLADLNAAAGDAPLLLLAEAKVVFYELLQGRYKWTVYAKFTVARRDDLQNATSTEADIPVFLLYDHEREPEAMRAAAPGLADRAGRLIDDFVRGRPDFKLEPGERQARSARGPIYFVMVDRFANGDRSNDGQIDPSDPSAFHGGDLQGVIDRLDWIQSLGMETVWLSPVFQMRTAKFFDHGAFHGYWVEDLNRIEPRFGDAHLLKKLSDEVHARGMKLILDVVLNHVAMDAPLTRQHPEWFHHQGPIKDWNNQSELETHDVHGLPDLAQEREDVYQFLLNASLHWIEEVKPDGFRLDAVKHIPLAFWQRYTSEVHARAGSDFWLLGEALDGEPAKLAALLSGGGFDALFDFPLKFALTDVFCHAKPIGRIAALLSLDDEYGDAKERLVTLVDNHDLPRVVTECKGDRARVEDALSVLFAVRGTPSIQYGTEIGLEGAGEPANRGDMRFTTHPLREHIAALARLRRNHAALQAGESRIESFDGERLVISRTLGDDSARISIAPRQVSITFAKEAPKPRALVRRPVEVAIGSAPLRDGDGIYLVGAGAELGSWDPSRGIGPIADRRTLALRTGAVYEFKLVIKHRDGTIAWEAGEDRFLFVDDGQGPLRVQAQWRAA